MELTLTKTPQGHLIPFSDEDADNLRRYKAGSTVRADIAEMRNGAYFRKWWVLAKFAFDVWCETVPQREYQGVAVQPDFERFRRDLIILAGFFRPVFAASGELRLEPESLKWSKMNEERFDKLYSATINVVLEKLLPKGRYSEVELRALVDRTMEFA
jgi:hypothetical protein